MTLQTELDTFRGAWEARVGEAITWLIAGDIEDLRGSGILACAARAGDAIPTDTTLLDAHGRRFDLGALVASRPVILTFYRGGWCPYCNLELRAFQARLADIRDTHAEADRNLGTIWDVRDDEFHFRDGAAGPQCASRLRAGGGSGRHHGRRAQGGPAEIDGEPPGA